MSESLSECSVALGWVMPGFPHNPPSRVTNTGEGGSCQSEGSSAEVGPSLGKLLPSTHSEWGTGYSR